MEIEIDWDAYEWERNKIVWLKLHSLAASGSIAEIMLPPPLHRPDRTGLG